MHNFANTRCQSPLDVAFPGVAVSDKRDRQQAIREVVSAHALASQEELRQHLVAKGWDVTQSTLSRDLRELRLARIRDGQGRSRYAFPEQARSDQALARLERMLPELLVDVEGVQVLVVARTMKSGAQPVAEALDKLEWPDVAGTIAGDDTVLIICRSPDGRERVLRRLRTYLDR